MCKPFVILRGFSGNNNCCLVMLRHGVIVNLDYIAANFGSAEDDNVFLGEHEIFFVDTIIISSIMSYTDRTNPAVAFLGE